MEREFELSIVNGEIQISKELQEYIKKIGTNTIKIKIIPDFEQVIIDENLPLNLVKKIAQKQRLPIDVALNVVRSKGKLKK